MQIAASERVPKFFFNRDRTGQHALSVTAGWKRSHLVIWDVVCFRSSAIVCLRPHLMQVQKGL